MRGLESFEIYTVVLPGLKVQRGTGLNVIPQTSFAALTLLNIGEWHTAM
jgi:hypothetical protein